MNVNPSRTIFRRGFFYNVLILCIFTLTLSACELSDQSPDALAELASGPNVWIEYPPDGEIFGEGAVPIVVYAAGQGGVGRLSVTVGGQVVPVGELKPLVDDSSLVRADLLWQPPAQGEYQIVASAGGAPTSSRFCSVTCETPQTEEVEEAGPTVTPSTTPTEPPFITLPAGETPDTPTPTTTQQTESSVEFWAAPPYINEGECTTLNWNVIGDFQAVTYEGGTVNASGSQSECPAESRDYQLQVVEMDGSTSDHWASVEVYQVDEPLPPTDTPTATPYSESSAEFWAAPPYINSGECTTLNWNVYGDFQAVYFEGTSVGASGSDEECPVETYTYNLQVVEMDGSTTDHWATVEVSEPPPEPPTDTPTPTEEPPPADTSGPSIDWTNGFLEACQFYGQAGITDESGVSWAQFYYNKNGEGWASVWMQEISAGNWESDGVMVSDEAVTIEYYVVASDELGNESESGTVSFVSEATGCGGY